MQREVLSKKNRRTDAHAGFTLIEVMVSVALFSIVMTICTTALLSLVDANKKSQAIQSVILNLNVAVDGMVRTLRMGTGFRVEGVAVGGVYSAMSFFPFGADTSNDANRIYLRHADTNADGTADTITKQYIPNIAGFTSQITAAITATEVKINKLAFFMEGTTATGTGDSRQPRVLIIIRGTAGSEKVKTTTSFNIQASATQRLLDI